MSDYKPEVGEECSIWWHDDWKTITPKFVGNRHIMFDISGEEWCHCINNDVRPIRTQEDIAREEAIDAMLDLYELSMRPTRDELRVLYDAGYGRLVGEKVAPEVLTSSFCNNMHQGTTHLAEHLLEKYDIFRKVVK